MVVKVEEIGEDGLELDEAIDAKFLEDALAHKGEETGFHALHGARLKATLRKVSGGVLLTGQFQAEVSAPCKRCLAAASASLPVSFKLNLMPRDLAQDEGSEYVEGGERPERAGSFRLEDADQEWFDGKTIELDPILREQILLALPMNLVCTESCRGLCPVCGNNLNEKQCECQREAMDPRWMALKNIKLS